MMNFGKVCIIILLFTYNQEIFFYYLHGGIGRRKDVFSTTYHLHISDTILQCNILYYDNNKCKWIELDIKLPHKMLSLVAVNIFDKLHFGIIVDILQIYNTSSKCIYSKRIKISNKCSFKWKLDDNIKKLLYNTHRYGNSILSIYSDSFDNDNWCLHIKRGIIITITTKYKRNTSFM